MNLENVTYYFSRMNEKKISFSSREITLSLRFNTKHGIG